MPKLNKTQAKSAANSEVKSFEALEDGWYTGRLAKVTTKTSRNGNEMWVWEFDEIEDLDGTPMPGRQWVNTVQTENSWWTFNMAFSAFGYTTDSDTDEIIGERCKLQVSKRIIEEGNRKGQFGNNVDNMRPLEGEGSETAGAGAETVF
jgi:hypothetical protein